LVLLGVCLFDLIPEMFEIGGNTSLVIMAASWAVFAAIHALQGGHLHADVNDAHLHSHTVKFLLGSMVLHCFAGGMLLVSSYELSARLAFHVFLGLIAHKGFEALAMSSLLLEKLDSRKQVILSVILYAISFPAGVIATTLLRQTYAATLSPERIENLAMVITSIAVGNLLGCLVQDFLVPAFREVKNTALRLGRAA